MAFRLAGGVIDDPKGFSMGDRTDCWGPGGTQTVALSTGSS